MFSGEEASEEARPELTEEQKERYRTTWGLKFDDSCIQQEKEWEEIAEETNKRQMEHLKEELSDYQMKRVEFVADKFVVLTAFEQRYLAALIQKRVARVAGINPLKLNMDWPSVKMDSDGTWPPLNPDWFKQQDIMEHMGSIMGGAGGGAEPAEEEEAADTGSETKEKDTFDVELSGFDAKSKIKLIKEIRGIFSLGLKEAKETVEGAPLWLKKGLKKEEADELVEKLTALGAELKIV
mmetsp:Transcript_25125/g.24875  ORF Transcript_25125/g.24875 Transcript_25125/m.24875 type:complete len:238 (-) Transcript_25125:30-743(-)|eukprot:CAMPEP_0196996164 /NCGR_PEP_ID=MMETSP1380-20130617/2116_1 /TAXON_ID=5936 /ORGANISM="Euplotes crassus, Strain CT5" /LENGTH=237 /DNA_ID=CAMNT_0042412051 /DNA_START=84 /DNA_END=797 /DNA_ORIENTATION=-